MKYIQKKNYYVLVVLLAVTILLTLSLASIYKNREKFTSSFYEYSNKITPGEFDEYMLENSNIIVYISDKYDLTNENFEKKFSKKLDQLNLKGNLIYIDEKDIDKQFLKKLKKTYDINIDLEKLPTVVVIIDNEVVKNVTIDSDSDVDTIIEYEAFK